MSLMDRPQRGESGFARRVRSHVTRKRAEMSDDAPAPGSLVRSVAFRQAVVYAVLFSFSVTLLYGFFYWSTAGYMERQAEATIEAERATLAERYRNQGIAGLSAFIRERLARQPAGPEIYLLAGPDYGRVVGNLSGWPSAEPDADGWVRFRLGEQGEHGTVVRWASAKVFRLRGDFHLLVGRDMQELDAIRATIVRTLVWGVGITVLMALVGGAMMGRSTSNRLRDINQAIRRIMAGDLAQRIPRNDSGDEFDRLAGNLNQMLDRIEVLMDGVRQVSDNIAHDLKTPLARMRSRLEALQGDMAAGDSQAAPAALAAVEDAIAEADALLATFGALLRIARIEASARRERFATVDLGLLLADVAELYEPLAEERGQAFTVDIAAGGSVHGDRDLLFQALANLLDNAVKYAPAGGRIDLLVEAGAHGPTVTVADNGPGVAPEFRRRVFERFWRADDSRSTRGSGLGLSLVAAVAALHEADVELQDNQPGLRISLGFPAATSLPGRA